MRLCIVALPFFINFLYCKPNSAVDSVHVVATITDFIQLSQNFLYAARTGASTSSCVDTLKNANLEDLNSQLENDSKKLAFWLNLYNGFTQVSLKTDPEQYRYKSSFFSKKQINIGGENMSLDFIEHGLLRRSKIKWSLGYLNKFFLSSFERKFRVSKLDNRIHFALNCGAKSCPPIAYYEPLKIDMQLEMATKAYLKSEVKYNESTNTASIPLVFSWFRGDFGGKKQVNSLLQRTKAIPAKNSPKIKYLAYHWDLHLNNYVSNKD